MGSLERARYAIFCALAALTMLLSARALAEPDVTKPSSASSAQYEELLDQAVSAFEAEDFSRAHALFEKAYAVRPNARVSRGLGIAALRLEHYTEAQRWLTSALADETQALTAAQRDEVTKLLAWMQSSLGVLRLHWKAPAPKNAEVSIDDVKADALRLWLSPGTHRLRARAPGFETREQSVSLVAGREQMEELSLTPLARAPELVTLSRDDMRADSHPAAASGAFQLQPASSTPEHHDSPGLLSRWWFWTAVGVVVAGGVTTAVLMTAKPAARPYEPGGEGGVLHARGVLP